MTYREIITNRNLLNNVPLTFEGRKLPKNTAASVMLLRVSYNQKVDEFVKTIEDVKKGLKKEGFDERAQAVSEMEAVDKRKKAADDWKEGSEGEKPSYPTEEEIEKAEKTRSTLKEFEAEKKELEEALMEANNKKLDEEVDMKNGKLTKDELADIYEVVGVEGDIPLSFPGGEGLEHWPREAFLSWIAKNLVE